MPNPLMEEESRHVYNCDMSSCHDQLNTGFQKYVKYEKFVA